MIIAVIGSGGKTSLIHKAAREYLKLGKTVLVTTTTHMYRETDTLINPKKEEVQHVLREKGYCMAGGLVQDYNEKREKIGKLPEKLYYRLCDLADVTLIEADGSRHKPFKWPASHEPAIPENVDEIWLVTGYSKKNCKAADGVQRYEMAGFPPEHRITSADVNYMIQEGYLKKLHRQFPGIPVRLFYR